MEWAPQQRLRPPLAYKARPHNGIWATPPYLHNGSVPSVYALLSPVSERPKVFYLGSKQYDPEYLGLNTDRLKGATEFCTDRPATRMPATNSTTVPRATAESAASSPTKNECRLLNT